MPRRSVLFALLMLVTAACAQNPYTGRHQLVMVPESYEQKLGAQSYAQVVQDPKNHISNDPREVEPVRRVADRIIEAAKQSKYADTAKKFQWEVSVIKDDKTANAFALPGGKIAVYTGIFPFAKTEAGLAAVLGHEVTHALARHGAERMSQGVLAQVGLEAAAIAMAAEQINPLTTQAAMAALGAGTQVGVLLPFSRKHESEADYVGILLAADAGYDPREAIALWQRMESSGGKQPAEFLSTHPSHGTRVKQLEEWMPEALQHYDKSPHAPNADLPALGGR
jgi:predicted Zn-dependent protease